MSCTSHVNLHITRQLLIVILKSNLIVKTSTSVTWIIDVKASPVCLCNHVHHRRESFTGLSVHHIPDVTFVFCPDSHPFLFWELPEESDQFRFLRVDFLVNLKGLCWFQGFPPTVNSLHNYTCSTVSLVVLILVKTSGMRITIPLDLSTWHFIPHPHFFHSRRTPPLLTPSQVLFPQHSS